MPKVLIFGDSHTGSLNAGLRRLKDAGAIESDLELSVLPLGGRFREQFFEERNGVASIADPLVNDRILRLPLEERGVVYGFCGPLHTMRVLWGRDWQHSAPSHLAKGETPVSASLLEKIFAEDQRYILLLLDLLVSRKEKVFVIEAPRLFEHSPVLANGKRRREVVLYLDDAYRRYVRRELASRGVAVVSVPARCIGNEGLMLVEFRHQVGEDPHHGNSLFGELMVREIVSFVRSQDQWKLERRSDADGRGGATAGTTPAQAPA